jgi:hypothetical protein
MNPVQLPTDLLAALTSAFARPMELPLEDESFNQLALRIFEWQFAHNTPYAAYCSRRRRSPDRIEHWTEIPAVPTAAFKEVALCAGSATDAEAVFRTSGTTRGGERRGTHYVMDISIYHGALLPNFAAMVVPDGIRPVMLSLMPRPRDLPDSSLAHMIATVIETLGSERSGWFATLAQGIDETRLRQALHDAQQRGDPVCLLGTSSSFVHWMDSLRATGTRYRLPDGSRLMDTGGFKGKGREVSPAELQAASFEWLGIASDYCINEYGMTELCSQFYDSALRDRVVRRLARERRKIVPPWVRTRVVDPETLQPLPPGRTGLLCHYDLANAGSVIAIQTEDMGVQLDEGFSLTGRAAGAPPRGCSLAMDELLAAVKERNA